MSLLTEKQKEIYNLYLRAYRTNNGQPFRAKKNFSDIEKDGDKLQSLQKIEKVFERYPAFFNRIFFDAPYKIYDDADKFYPLKFFSSQKGITTCIAYIKTLQQGNPDEQLEFMKESYKFVAQFCQEKGIPLERYTAYCSVSQNDCLLHLKEHKISWFLVFSIPHFHDLLRSLQQDEFELYYGSNVDLPKMYNLFASSLKTREYLADIKKKISSFLQKKIAP